MRRALVLASAAAALAVSACQSYPSAGRGAGAPPPGAYPSPAVPSGESLVLEIQTRLNDQGYDAGPEDGLYGPRTRRAIQAYQADHALVPDGEPDLDLVERLQASAGERRPIPEAPPADGGWIDPSP